MPNDVATIKPGNNFLISNNTGIYFVYYELNGKYLIDILAHDTDGVRMISASSSNIGYWSLENNLYVTNNTNYDIISFCAFRII